MMTVFIITNENNEVMTLHINQSVQLLLMKDHWSFYVTVTKQLSNVISSYDDDA
jgi:hypothetical protein